MGRLLSAAEAAQILAVSRRRLRLLVHHGGLPSVRTGTRQMRFSAEALAAWVDAGGLKAADRAAR